VTGQTPDVYANAGYAAARCVNLADLGAAVFAAVAGNAEAISKTGSYASSIRMAEDKSFGAVSHYVVYSVDPGALSIEWDHMNNWQPILMEGKGVFTRAYNQIAG
jgi:hypothetical protein